MYNGVGLKTARGSGTNGYVQKNLSALSNGRERSLRDRRDDRDWSDAPSRKPDAGILEHERKRKVELQCLELQVELEDKGLSEEDIERQVSDLRTSLLRNLSVAPTRAEAKQLRPSDVHKLQAAKEVESSKFQRALGVSADYREGDAFNPEVQERRKLERIEERKRRDEERVRVAAEREAAYKAARAAREKEEQDRRDFQNELDRKRSRDDVGREPQGRRAPAMRYNSQSPRPTASRRDVEDTRRPTRYDDDSPPARRRRRDSSLSASPRRRYGSSRSRSRSRSRSLPRRRREPSFSKSPPPRRRRDNSPPRRGRESSYTPTPPRDRTPPPRSGRDRSPPRRRYNGPSESPPRYSNDRAPASRRAPDSHSESRSPEPRRAEVRRARSTSGSASPPTRRRRASSSLSRSPSRSPPRGKGMEKERMSSVSSARRPPPPGPPPLPPGPPPQRPPGM